jgi:hypothetical protein
LDIGGASMVPESLGFWVGVITKSGRVEAPDRQWIGASWRSAHCLAIGARLGDRCIAWRSAHASAIGARLGDRSARAESDLCVRLSCEFLGGCLSGLGLQHGMQLGELRRREDGKQCIQSGRSHRWAKPKQIDHTHPLSRAAGSTHRRSRRRCCTRRRSL